MPDNQVIKTVIIDDELNNREHLHKVLNKYCPHLEVIGKAHNAISGMQLIQEQQPQLVFLDIQMPGGNGFDLLEAMPKREFKVIFVTAFDQYAIKAIRFCAFDYLLKPINVLDLQKAVTRVTGELSNPKQCASEQWSLLSENYRNEEKRMALPTSERVLFVSINNIVRCKGENNYTFVYLKNGEKVLVSRTLKDFEEMLDSEGFIRVHQSHLVNKSMVKSFEKGEGGYLLMNDGSQVSISRLRKEKVIKQLVGR